MALTPGKPQKLKTMWLRPDAYNIEIRAAGYTPYAQRLYLLPGKTVKVKADHTAVEPLYVSHL